MIPTATRTAVACTGVTKSFGSGDARVQVLRGVDIEVAPGEITLLVGPSGCGKTTLISIIAGLLEPTSGGVCIFDRRLGDLRGDALVAFRARMIGFVFQQYNLIWGLSAAENVAMPALIHRRDRRTTMTAARELLDRVGLGHRADHRPGELSGGESQRVALARALIMKPDLLLADEPTGNLDPETGEGIHALLRTMNKDLGITAIVVTHNEVLARSLPRRLRLKDGLVVDADLT